MKTAEELRKAFQARYPDVENEDFSLEHSGFAHEHPLTAIGVVLLASVVLRTTDVTKLSKFTGYSRRFVRAIAINMENSRLWKDGKYDHSGWSSVSLSPRNKREQAEFWDHIQIAAGWMWEANAKTDKSEDASEIQPGLPTIAVHHAILGPGGQPVIKSRLYRTNGVTVFCTPPSVKIVKIFPSAVVRVSLIHVDGRTWLPSAERTTRAIQIALA